jgi:CDP-diacylglycerol--serine O-phosphatidyltransferase
MLTLGNLFCGFFAIVVAARVDKPESVAVTLADTTNVLLAAWLIFLAMVFDALDGYVARLSGTSSNFGAQLDSLCDLVTFGVAPAFLLVKMCPHFTYVHQQFVWVIAAAFAGAAALRLARFSLETDEEDDHLQFTGLPTPAGAAAIASFAIMFDKLRQGDTWLPMAAEVDWALQMVLPYFGLLVAVLMVSRIPYPHVVSQVLSGQRSFAHVVALLFSVAAVMALRGYAVPLICCGFVLLGPGRVIWEKVVERRRRKDALF